MLTAERANLKKESQVVARPQHAAAIVIQNITQSAVSWRASAILSYINATMKESILVIITYHGHPDQTNVQVICGSSKLRFYLAPLNKKRRK